MGEEESMREERRKRLRVNLSGYPAYILDRLNEEGMYGDNRAEILRYIILDWGSTRHEILSSMGINPDDAKKRGYIPKEDEE